MVKRRNLLALIVCVLLPVLCSSATTDVVETGTDTPTTNEQQSAGQDEVTTLLMTLLEVTTDSSVWDETTTSSDLILDQNTINNPTTTAAADSTDQTVEPETSTATKLKSEPRHPSSIVALLKGTVQLNEDAGTGGAIKVNNDSSTTEANLLTTDSSDIDKNQESTTFTASLQEEDSTAITTESMDLTLLPTDASGLPLAVNDQAAAAIIPLPVKIFDPRVDVEATTFLAEANLQTESSDVTTESFPFDEQELLATTETDLSLMMTGEVTTETGFTESETNSGTEWTSDTSTFSPPSPLPSPPSPFVASGRQQSTYSSSKKRNYKGYKVYRVVLPTEDSVRRIMALEDEPGIEFWADPRLLLRPRGLFVTSAADVMVAPTLASQVEDLFRQSRLLYSLLVADVQTAIAKENPIVPSFARSQLSPSSSGGNHRLTWERYHRLDDIKSFMDYLKASYPEWIELVPIGKSSQGRTIHVIKLSKRRDNGLEASKKKAILIDAGMHANEWITPAALTWMVNELADNSNTYECILDRFDWYFIPVLNPDGYEYSHTVDRLWRKTRRNYTSPLLRSTARKLRVDDGESEENCVGADINRNFEFAWRKGGSSSNVCSPAFAGMKPFSEPESRALANFMLKQRSKLAMYISLHSYSQMWLLPWGFSEARPEDFSELYSLAKIGAKAIQRVHNTSYLIGSVPDLLTLASGTSQDWAKGVAGVNYSYTIEIRGAGERGMILPAKQIVPTSEETWAGILAAASELADRLYPHLSSCSLF